MMNNTNCNRPDLHCESCGSTDPEDINPFANDGYSACCNELVVSGPHDCLHATYRAAAPVAPVARKSSSHANCSHPATKAARAACRKAHR